MIIQRLLPWRRPSHGIFNLVRPPISPSPLPSSRRCLHQIAPLTHQRIYENEGVPGLLSVQGFDLAWTQYQGYMVDELNRLTKGTTSYHSGTRDLLLAAARQPEHASLFNYASMAHNNHFFFHGLSPTKTNMSQSLARDHLLHSFTNINTLRDEMILTANAMFGPGFVWLVKMTDPKYHNTPEYRILTTYLAGTPYPAAHYRTQSHDMSTMPRDALPITNSPLGTRLTTTDTSPGPSTRDGGNVNGPTPADLNRQTHYQNQYPGAVGNRSHAAKDRVSLVPLLCVNTWQHVWMWDYGIAGKYNYLQAWWERIDWGVVERKVNEGAKDQKFSNQQRY